MATSSVELDAAKEDMMDVCCGESEMPAIESDRHDPCGVRQGNNGDTQIMESESVERYHARALMTLLALCDHANTTTQQHKDGATAGNAQTADDIYNIRAWGASEQEVDYAHGCNVK